MIKDMMELKPTESPLSDFDIIQVEIHRCPKCERQFNIFFFQAVYSAHIYVFSSTHWWQVSEPI